MRKTKVPPWWRAKAQLYRAVRASPTWGDPVGEGAIRTRTAPTPSVALVETSVTLDHLVGEVADALDRDLDLVTGVHGTDTLGGAGEDHVAGQQRHHAGDVGDQGRYVEDQVGGAAVLLDLAVEEGLHTQVADVQIGLDPRPEGAEGVEALGPGELPVLALQVARRHVVADRVAVDDVGVLLLGY